MFLILGITWILDIVGWVLTAYNQTSIICQMLKCVFDFINSLQGVILFCVLYFTNANLKKIKTCFKRSRNDSSFGRQTSSGTNNNTNTTLNTNLIDHDKRLIATRITNVKNDISL